MTLGLALTQDLEVQVLSSYVAGLHDIDAVATSATGWHVCGEFRMPETEDVRLEIFGVVSDVSLTLRARLFCVEDDAGVDVAQEVSGSFASHSSTVNARATSGAFELQGGRLYEFQMQVYGGVSTSLFGSMISAQLLNA